MFSSLCLQKKKSLQVCTSLFLNNNSSTQLQIYIREYIKKIKINAFLKLLNFWIEYKYCCYLKKNLAQMTKKKSNNNRVKTHDFIARFWHRVENDRMHVRPVIILASMHDDIARQLVVKSDAFVSKKRPIGHHNSRK